MPLSTAATGTFGKVKGASALLYKSISNFSHFAINCRPVHFYPRVAGCA